MSKKIFNDVLALVNVIKKGEDNLRSICIDDIISNPISCGYLLDFCQKGYCAENLNFFMAVDKFRDECSILDFRDASATTTCKSMADKIWADYLSLNSPNEVSLPSEDREATIERMKSPSEHRGRLFDVALKDALKTLQKDTLPRFLRSPQYHEMAAKVLTVQGRMEGGDLDSDGSLQLSMPTATNLTDDSIMSSKEYSLNEILKDRILFTEMLEYLEKKFKAENLKCARQIRRFEEMIESHKPDSLKDFAWDIYLYFVAPASPYEVSCTTLDRKAVQLRLGCPHKHMFDPIMENTLLILKQDHKAFCQQINVKKLKDRLKAGNGPTAPKSNFLTRIKLI